MKLDDLKKMNIPRLSPIEIEVDRECIPPATEKRLCYLADIEESNRPRLIYYGSQDAEYKISLRSGYEFIDSIRSVVVLVPR